MNSDYFFLIFLGTIAVIRFFLLWKVGSPTIRGFRLRHYMYGVILIILAFFNHNLTIYAIGFGLLVDELPLILIKGPGHKEHHWRGMEDYYSPWCVSGVLVFVFLTYLFRDLISGLI